MPACNMSCVLIRNSLFFVTWFCSSDNFSIAPYLSTNINKSRDNYNLTSAQNQCLFSSSFSSSSKLGFLIFAHHSYRTFCFVPNYAVNKQHFLAAKHYTDKINATKNKNLSLSCSPGQLMLFTTYLSHQLLFLLHFCSTLRTKF